MRFFTLWAINDALDLPRLTRQLDDFVDAGLDGVVFHPRFYPGEPAYLGAEYFAIVSAVIVAAKQRGLAFWIYDEDGWPSGTVGGRMLREHPELRQTWLEPRDGSFEVHKGAGVDYLSPGLAPALIELCYAAYRDGLTPEAWDHVEAFFDDEPEFGLGHAYDGLAAGGAIPWTPDLPERYAERTSRDLPSDLPSLFVTTPDSAVVRVAFWELASDLLAERFLRPLDEWCAAQGKRFTAHVKGEEHPLFQVPTVGSSTRVLRAIGMPGIDALGRDPGNEFYVRQAASVARQFGDGRVMAEAFGGAGWGATPADLEAYLLWLGRSGATDVALHLSQYRLDSAALTDWPPSIPRHVTWSAAFRDVLERVKMRVEYVPSEVLVVTPHRAIMAEFEPRELLQMNVHDAGTYAATPAGAINDSFLALVESIGPDVDYTDERTLALARREGDRLVLGHASYSSVVLAESAALDEMAARLVEGLVREAPSAPRVPIDPPSLAELLVSATDWTLVSHPVNELPLHLESHDSDHRAVLQLTAELSIHLVFADAVESLRIDGQPLEVTPIEDGCASLSGILAPGTHEITFTSARLGWAWARGLFRVDSLSPFVPADNNTVVTDGGFVLSAPRETVARDATADGFPFLREPLPLSATIPTDRIAVLAGGRYDAARLAGHWVWQSDAPLPVTVAAGEVTLDLVGSTYNVYGPHHYYRGDTHVVSPGQVLGDRNFADPLDAPEHTHVAGWHVRPLLVPELRGFDE